MNPDLPESARTEAAQRILLAAERLFGERGYNGVSIRDIADAADASKANVFHHFSSKLALYEAVLQSGSTRFRGLLQLLTAGDRDLPGSLRDFDRQHLKQMLEQEWSSLLFLRQLLEASAGEERQLVEDVVGQSFDLVVSAFADFKRRGELADHVDPAVLGLTLLGGHIAYFLLRDVLRGRRHPAADPDTFSRLMVDHLLTGIRPGGDGPPHVESSDKKGT
jgi:TetR/AcrR family transcriptional regulator